MPENLIILSNTFELEMNNSFYWENWKHKVYVMRFKQILHARSCPSSSCSLLLSRWKFHMHAKETWHVSLEDLSKICILICSSFANKDLPHSLVVYIRSLTPEEGKKDKHYKKKCGSEVIFTWPCFPALPLKMFPLQICLKIYLSMNLFFNMSQYPNNYIFLLAFHMPQENFRVIL